MFATLIQTAGLWFLIACAVEAVAVFAEQAGAARSPEDDAPRNGAVALVAFLLTLITPGLLLAHGFLSTRGHDETLRVMAIGAPIAAVLAGALLGAIFGAAAKAAAPAMRKLALPLDLAALALTVYATLPSIRILIEAAQNGGVIVTN
ncbi:MAG: hypothetical protein AB7H66_02530 [Hyphomonadaceae bacterium]